jgi:hypothetical protein
LVHGADEHDAGLAVASAESRVVECYNFALDAERAGADISELLRVLNEAGDLLSKAELAFGVGDYDGAATYAAQCEGRLAGFEVQAQALRDSASWQRQLDLMVNVVGSAAGTVAVLVGGWLVWRYLKRHGVAEAAAA